MGLNAVRVGIEMTCLFFAAPANSDVSNHEFLFSYVLCSAAQSKGHAATWLEKKLM
jgi:hypothetical protein